GTRKNVVFSKNYSIGQGVAPRVFCRPNGHPPGGLGSNYASTKARSRGGEGRRASGCRRARQNEEFDAAVLRDRGGVAHVGDDEPRSPVRPFDEPGGGDLV